MMELSTRKRLQQISERSLQLARRWTAPSVRRHIWRALTGVSLGIVGIGLLFAWRDLPSGSLQLTPWYLLLAGMIYGITYAMHTLGWHCLAQHFFGSFSLRENAEAVATSNLVKYLPTIAWYIANRTEYYQQRNVPRKMVVAASLCELAAMIGVGTLLYLLGETVSHSIVLTLALLVVATTIVVSAGRSQGLIHVWVRRRFKIERTKKWSRFKWIASLAWYGGTWPLGILFLATIMRAFTPLSIDDIWLLSRSWLLAGLASYAVSLSLGSFGFAREITLTYLLAQYWPLPIAIAVTIFTKILLTAGEIVCSGLVLTYLRAIK